MKLISGSLKFAGGIALGAALLGQFIHETREAADGSPVPWLLGVIFIVLGWALGCLGTWWRAARRRA